MTAEQNLISDLIREAIQIHGIETRVCPRTIENRDHIFNEDNISHYNENYSIAMYLKDIEGFGGEGDILSKFNIQVRDEVNLTVSKCVFENVIGRRPYEGDIIYLPLMNSIWQIKFVENEVPFYQLGALYTYDLSCELFEYSNEILNTGISNIDSLMVSLYSTGVIGQDAVTPDANGTISIDEATGRPVDVANTYNPGGDNSNYDKEDSFVLENNNLFGDITE